MDAIAMDGWLEEETVPGDLHGSTALFRLTVSPTEDRMDEMILPCVVVDSLLVDAVLYDLQPGDRLRVTGHLRLPGSTGDGMCLRVDTLEVLETAPVPAGAALLGPDGSIERYGPYVCWIDPDSSEVAAGTEAGAWVGTAPQPSEVGELLTDYEQRQAAGGE